MRSFYRWAIVTSVSVPVVVFIACGSKQSALPGDDDAGYTTITEPDGAVEIIQNPPSSSGMFMSGPMAEAGIDEGPCKGGFYKGAFAGSYTSHLTVIGFPIPVTGDVNLTLEQQGTMATMCRGAGEIPEPCNDVYTLKNGTIQGTADEVHIGDASFGGFPYFCSLTGTLDCPNKILVDGWIQCTYCIGPLADGGGACALLDTGMGGATGTGVGGHFAGPLTANYNYGALAFVMGNWNGAETLAGNNGTPPYPDGGTDIWDYLQDSGNYVGQDFGGSSGWNAIYQP